MTDDTPPPRSAVARPAAEAATGKTSPGDTSFDDTSLPRGADLARQVLAQAKQDARARAREHGRGLPAGPGGAGRRRRSGGDADGRTHDHDGDHDHEGEGEGGGPAGDAANGGGPGRGPRRLPGIAAPGRRWREPVGFGTAIARLVAERGWKEQATDASVLARWDVLVGPDIASHCTPVSLRDGVLELAAESTAWATQLRMLSRQLLTTLRAELGGEVVTRIVVRGPTAPSWKHGPLRAPGGRGPRDTYG